MRGGRRVVACWIALTATLGSARADGVGAQMAEGPLVDAEWLEAHLESDHVSLLHADMRRSAYDEGHLPGARFLDMTALVWDGEPAWGTEMRSASEVEAALEQAGVRDTDHHVVVYSTNPLFASRAFLTLEAYGMRGRVHVLDGGFGGWQADGRAVTNEEPAPRSGSVTLTPVPDLLVDADWILERLDDPSVALVDARPDAEYTGEDGGMGGMANPGHIPGAHQMYWEELIESRETPRLLPLDEVRVLFENAGAGAGDTVVAYCMVGWRASYTYLAARLLGYETKFYDGSWHDWGTRDDLPYVRGSSPR